MATTDLMIELWQRTSAHGPLYRGLVRRGDQYLYKGDWLPQKLSAIRDAEDAAHKISRQRKPRVLH
jgi:hypothetical protein